MFVLVYPYIGPRVLHIAELVISLANLKLIVVGQYSKLIPSTVVATLAADITEVIVLQNVTCKREKPFDGPGRFYYKNET